MNKQKITPFLWFDKGKAREAAKFYAEVFSRAPGSRPAGKDANIMNPQNLKDTPSGDVEIITIELFGQNFTLMGAGPEFKFNEAISFVIDCDGQEEVDYYWNTLTEEGEESQCGWLKDKFGVSWQVVPKQLNEALANPNPEKAKHAMKKMLQMKKIVISDLE